MNAVFLSLDMARCPGEILFVLMSRHECLACCAKDKYSFVNWPVKIVHLSENSISGQSTVERVSPG